MSSAQIFSLKQNFVLQTLIDSDVLSTLQLEVFGDESKVNYSDSLQIRKFWNNFLMFRYFYLKSKVSFQYLSSYLSNSKITQIMYPLKNSKTLVSYIIDGKLSQQGFTIPRLYLNSEVFNDFIPVFSFYLLKKPQDDYETMIYSMVRPGSLNLNTSFTEIFRMDSYFYLSRTLIGRVYQHKVFSNQMINCLLSLYPLTKNLNTLSTALFQSKDFTLLTIDNENKPVKVTILFQDPEVVAFDDTLTLIYYNTYFNPMINIAYLIRTYFPTYNPNYRDEYQGVSFGYYPILDYFFQYSMQLDQALTLNSVVSQYHDDSTRSVPYRYNTFNTVYSNYLIFKSDHSHNVAFTGENTSILDSNGSSTYDMFFADPSFFKAPRSSDYSILNNKLTRLDSYSSPMEKLFNGIFLGDLPNQVKDVKQLLYRQYIEINDFWEILRDMQPNYTDFWKETNINLYQRTFCDLFKLGKVQSSSNLGYVRDVIFVYLNCIYIQDESSNSLSKYYVIAGLQILPFMNKLYPLNSPGYYCRNIKTPLEFDYCVVKPFYGFFSLHQALRYLSKKLSYYIIQYSLINEEVENFAKQRDNTINTIVNRYKYKKLSNEQKTIEFSKSILEQSFYYIMEYFYRVILQNPYTNHLPKAFPKLLSKTLIRSFEIGLAAFRFGCYCFFKQLSFKVRIDTIASNGFPDTGIPEALLKAFNDKNYSVYYSLLNLNPKALLFFDNNNESLRPYYDNFHSDPNSGTTADLEKLKYKSKNEIMMVSSLIMLVNSMIDINKVKQ